MEDEIEKISRKIAELERESKLDEERIESRIVKRYSEIEKECGEVYLDEEYTSLIREKQNIMDSTKNKIQQMKAQIQDIRERELEKVKTEYLTLVTQKEDIKEEINKDEKIVKESKLFKTREELKQEIVRLKKLGKKETDSEIIEYKRDIELISRELDKVEKKLYEKRTELNSINERLQEIERNGIQEQLVPKTDIQEEVQQEVQEDAKETVLSNKEAIEEDKKIEEIGDLKSIIKNIKVDYNFDSKISYVVSERGIYYNGVLQDEDELYDYIFDDKFEEEILRVLGEEKTQKFQEKYDPYIVAAILNNEFDWCGESEEYIENAKKDRVNKYYDLIINKNKSNDVQIQYDLKNVSWISRLLGKSKLSNAFVNEVKEYAYKSRGVADVFVDKITNFKFKINDFMMRKKHTIKYQIPENTEIAKKSWELPENYLKKLKKPNTPPQNYNKISRINDGRN